MFFFCFFFFALTRAGFDYCMNSGLFMGFLFHLFYVVRELDWFLHQELISHYPDTYSGKKSPTEARVAILCTIAMLSCGFFEDCKEQLKDSFGHLHITYSAKFSPDCTWTIGNSGISGAVAIVSIEEVQFGYCR